MYGVYGPERPRLGLPERHPLDAWGRVITMSSTGGRRLTSSPDAVDNPPFCGLPPHDSGNPPNSALVTRPSASDAIVPTSFVRDTTGTTSIVSSDDCCGGVEGVQFPLGVGGKNVFL
ncbi:hypothetical protein ACLOJK_006908 [Asimina triloba]